MKAEIAYAMYRAGLSEFAGRRVLLGEDGRIPARTD